MTRPSNPYQFLKPVFRPGEFFDRRAILARLARALLARRSVQLVGQYRIGKSSILRYMEANKREFCDDDSIIPIYYDLAHRADLKSEDDFYAHIWRLTSQALVAHGEPQAALEPGVNLEDAEGFDAYIDRWVTREGYCPVFLLDEFGAIARNENFGQDFNRHLRSASNQLPFVVVARYSLAEYSLPSLADSPLWNVLETINVGLLEDRAAADEIIRAPAERVGLRWAEEAERFIYTRGGQHPRFLQMAASALYDSLDDEYEPDFRQAERVFRDTAVGDFRGFWFHGLEDPDRPERTEVLRQGLLDLMREMPIDDDVAEDLEKHGLVWHHAGSGCWRLLSEYFADWLKRWTTDKRARAAAESQAQPAPPKPGLDQEGEFGGRYRVLRVLGTTRHSAVSLAWDEKLERLVAIKSLHLAPDEPGAAVEAMKERLGREARILASLKHPNVGPVFDWIEMPSAVVMEWIPGLPLHDVMSAKGKMRPLDVVDLAIPLADALAYVHHHDKCHRDVKPANIILSLDPEHLIKPVLIDFDIARAGTEHTISRDAEGEPTFVGTRAYSAPEQFEDPEAVGPWTDLFSLGVVLYQALTGQTPYLYGNKLDLYSDRRFPPPNPNGIPAPLYDILCGLLQGPPGERPSAASLKQSLIACRDELARTVGQPS